MVSVLADKNIYLADKNIYLADKNVYYCLRMGAVKNVLLLSVVPVLYLSVLLHCTVLCCTLYLYKSIGQLAGLVVEYIYPLA